MLQLLKLGTFAAEPKRLNAMRGCVSLLPHLTRNGTSLCNSFWQKKTIVFGD